MQMILSETGSRLIACNFFSFKSQGFEGRVEKPFFFAGLSIAFPVKASHNFQLLQLWKIPIPVSKTS